MKKNVKNFLILTACAAGTIHLINRFIDATAEMKNILKAENGDYYDWKNGKIYYTKGGHGSPVLLIHDLDPISSSYEWCRLRKKLEKTHTVYAIDLLGCGRSDKPALTYTNYLYVQLITDFITNIIKNKPDVIATNYSLSFTVLAQNMNQDLMNRIIAINPPAIEKFNGTPNKYSVVKKALLQTPILGTFVYNILTHQTYIQRKLQNIYFCKPQLVSSKMMDAYYESAHKHLSHGKYLLASMEGHYTDNSMEHALKNLEIPLYIIESREFSDAVSITDSYAKRNPLVETAYISNTKLIPQLEAPEKLLSIIHMFIGN